MHAFLPRQSTRGPAPRGTAAGPFPAARGVSRAPSLQIFAPARATWNGHTRSCYFVIVPRKRNGTRRRICAVRVPILRLYAIVLYLFYFIFPFGFMFCIFYTRVYSSIRTGITRARVHACRTRNRC